MEVDLLAVTPEAEKVIESAGRTCYRSHDRISAESAPKFVRMLISRGHLSVLEHAYATFRVSGISRATTHQLVRHRLCSFSQRSQRYVREREAAFVMPPSIGANQEAMQVFDGLTSSSRDAYDRLIELGIPKEDARFVLPNSAPSEIVMSANFRELRHIILTRGSRHAQWEVRDLAAKLLRLMKQHAPNVFFDLETTEDGSVEQRHSQSF
jgi:thymidylate synthase (FAD)